MASTIAKSAGQYEVFMDYAKYVTEDAYREEIAEQRKSRTISNWYWIENNCQGNDEERKHRLGWFTKDWVCC